MSKGYTNLTTLATYMGMTFTALQMPIADLAIGAAEHWIDNEIRHAWLEPDPIIESRPISKIGQVRLLKPPIKTIEKVSARWVPGGTLMEAVLAGETGVSSAGYYYVQSLRDGLFIAPAAIGAFEIVIEYTPNDDTTAPDEVALAANVLAAASLRTAPTFNGDIDPTMVQRYMVGGELEVEFRKGLIGNAGALIQARSYLDTWLRGYTVV